LTLTGTSSTLVLQLAARPADYSLEGRRKMDYRNYRGEEPLIPPKLRRYLHFLRPVGVFFSICGLILPFLTLLRLIESTYFINFLTFFLLLLGPIFYLVGSSFDSYVDRVK
jgi:hypothetical protein